MYNPFTLSGKTILITGASSGIGRATAVECSKMGATVVVTGRNEERLSETFNLLNGENHITIVADLSKDEDLNRLVAQLPILNGVVHCAGIIKTLPFQFVNAAALSEMMEINFTAPTLISAQLIKNKKLIKGSSIVFISSVAGRYYTLPANSMYTASKSAIDGIAKGMAVDLAPKGIRVNCVNPGMVETNIFNEGIISAEQFEADKKRYPLKRYGKPDEVAYAVIYLLSDAASWVTGSNLLIDGGYTLQ